MLLSLELQPCQNASFLLFLLPALWGGVLQAISPRHTQSCLQSTHWCHGTPWAEQGLHFLFPIHNLLICRPPSVLFHADFWMKSEEKIRWFSTLAYLTLIPRIKVSVFSISELFRSTSFLSRKPIHHLFPLSPGDQPPRQTSYPPRLAECLAGSPLWAGLVPQCIYLASDTDVLSWGLWCPVKLDRGAWLMLLLFY